MIYSTYNRGKPGDLTRKDLARGYAQRRHAGNIEVTLWREHGSYYVRAIHYTGDNKGKCHYWQTFNSLRDARRCFYEPVGVK